MASTQFRRRVACELFEAGSDEQAHYLSMYKGCGTELAAQLHRGYFALVAACLPHLAADMCSIAPLLVRPARSGSSA